MKQDFCSLSLKIIFRATGIDADSKEETNFEKYFFYIYIVSFPVIIIPQFIAVMTAKDFIGLLNCFATFYVSLTILLVYFHLRKNKTIIVRMFDYMTSDKILESQYKYFDEKLKKRLKYYSFNIGLLGIVVSFTPLLIKSSLLQDSTTVDPMLKLVIAAVYPWDPNSSLLSYTITFILQSILVTLIFSIAAGQAFFLNYTATFFSCVSRSTRIKTANIDENIKSNSEKRNASQNSVENQKLDDLVRYYQRLRRVFVDTKTVLMAYVYFAITTFFISGAILTVAVLSLNSDYYRLRMMAYMYNFMMNLAFAAELGTSYQEMNDNVSTALYETKWYEKDLNYQKKCLQFMRLLQFPMTIQVFKVKILNWGFITNISRFTYSALQLFLQFRS